MRSALRHTNYYLLPDFGQIFADQDSKHHARPVLDPDLVARVAESTGLTVSEAARVVGDVLAHYAEPVEDYVRRRHARLQLHGTRNPEIFPILQSELEHRLVAAPPLTERQLRRMIYG
jgi:hypothetical protein